MPKYKVFISSVQSEFSQERQRIYDFIRNRVVVRNPGTLPVKLTKADLMKEHGSYPHNPYLAEVMYQMGYIEKYGTGITENIRRMQEAHLLAPEIDLSAEFITTIWRDNIGINIGTNDATNDATPRDYLAVNKRIIDRKVKKKVRERMTEKQLKECIIEACYVEHSVEELAKLLNKSVSHIRNRFITNMVADGIILRTKLEHSIGQTYMTNPKLDKKKS